MIKNSLLLSYQIVHIEIPFVHQNNGKYPCYMNLTDFYKV